MKRDRNNHDERAIEYERTIKSERQMHDAAAIRANYEKGQNQCLDG